MPSRNMKVGDTGYVRMTVLEVHSDALQVQVDDGVRFGLVTWVPSGECALFEDIGDLKPIRRANPRHIER